MTTDNFYTEIFINSMPDKVWDILFSQNGFFKSFFGTEIHSTFNIGDTIEFVTIENNIKTVHIYGNIKAYDKHKLLNYTEHPGAIYAENHKDLQSDTKITFDQVGNTTRLTLLCDNFSDKTLKYKSNQWYLILSNLKTFIETGYLLNLK
jgi:Activator of Hsp90 ATPase homolog 1-like protein